MIIFNIPSHSTGNGLDPSLSLRIVADQFGINVQRLQHELHSKLLAKSVSC